MEKIVGQMKVNKEQIYKQIKHLTQRINQLMNEITVDLVVLFLSFFFFFTLRKSFVACRQIRTVIEFGFFFEMLRSLKINSQY